MSSNEADDDAALGRAAFEVFANRVKSEVAGENSRLRDEVVSLEPAVDHLAHVELRLGPHYGTDRVVPVPGGLRVAELRDEGRSRREVTIPLLDAPTVPLEEVGGGNAKALVSHTLVAKFASPSPGRPDLDPVIFADSIDREKGSLSMWIPDWTYLIFLSGEVSGLSVGDIDRLAEAGGNGLMGQYLRGEGGLDSSDPTFSFRSISITDNGQFPSQTQIYESAIMVKNHYEMGKGRERSLMLMLLDEWLRSPQMAALPREDEMQLRNLLIGDAISDQSTPEPSDDEALKATILNLQGSNEGLLDENSQLRGTKELSTKIGALISTIKITFDNEEHLFVLSDSRDHNTTLVGDSSGLNSEEDDGRYLVFAGIICLRAQKKAFHVY